MKHRHPFPFALVSFAALLLSGIAACHAPHIRPSGVGYVTPGLAILTTPGVRIEAMDADWVIEDGKAFVPPFVYPFEGRSAWATPDWLPLFVHGFGSFGIATAFTTAAAAEDVYVRYVFPGTPAHQAGIRDAWVHSVNGTRITSRQEFHRRLGINSAHPDEERSVRFRPADTGSLQSATLKALEMPPGFRVRIHHPASKRPLYGRLAFFRVLTPTDSSARRQWTLAIPDAQVNQASGGRVATVFQPYTYTYESMQIQGPRKSHEDTEVSWVLWMSDIEETFEAPKGPKIGVWMDQGSGGVRITFVRPGSVAELSGLRKGDVVTQFANLPTTVPGDLATAIRQQKPGTETTAHIRRDGAPLIITVRFPATGE